MLSAEEIREGYNFFLGRDPEPTHGWTFANHDEMHRALIGSPEYKTKARSRKNGLGWPLNQVFVIPQLSLIYCPIGKNACTTLKQHMARLARHPDLEMLLRDIHLLTDHCNTGLQLSDLPRDEVDHILADPNLMSVAVLRDPAERMLSAYLEKCVYGRLSVPNQAHTVQVMRRAQGVDQPDFKTGISFRKFVSTVIAENPRTTDPHWRKQSLYLEGVTYSDLVTISGLEALLKRLENRAGLSLPRKAENRAPRPSSKDNPRAPDLTADILAEMPRPASSSFFDAQITGWIREYYAEDYALMARAQS